MEDIHSDLVNTASGNKMIGVVCFSVAGVIVLMAVTVSVIFSFHLFPWQLTENEKDLITNYAQSGLIIAIILSIGAWFMMIKSLKWFRLATKIFNEAEPVKMNAIIKSEKTRETKDVEVELADGEKKIVLFMYYPNWDVESLTDSEVDVFKNEENEPIVVKTSMGILWPYPPVVKN